MLVVLTNLVNGVAIYVCITHQLWRHPPYFPRHTVSYWAELLPRIKIALQCHKVDKKHSSSCFQQCNVFIGPPGCKISPHIYYLVHIILTRRDLRLSVHLGSAVELFTREMDVYYMSWRAVCFSG